MLNRLKVTDRGRGRKRRFRPGESAREDRRSTTASPAVDARDDGGEGRLRRAVDRPKARSGADAIDFKAGPFIAPQSITLTGKQRFEPTDMCGTTTITDPAAGPALVGGSFGEARASVAAQTGLATPDVGRRARPAARRAEPRRLDAAPVPVVS